MAASLAPVHGKDEAEFGMKFFGDRGGTGPEAAAKLYAAAAAAARQPALYIECGVPDTLDGRFEMVTMHLFALTYRLMHDPGDDPDLARHVTESFITDMDGTFREMGVGDMSVPKRMKALYSSFAGRLNAYGSGVKEGEGALAAALARNVFPDRPEDNRVSALASHLAATLEALKAAPLADLRRGRVNFPSPQTSQAEAHP